MVSYLWGFLFLISLEPVLKWFPISGVSYFPRAVVSYFWGFLFRTVSYFAKRLYGTGTILLYCYYYYWYVLMVQYVLMVRTHLHILFADTLVYRKLLVCNKYAYVIPVGSVYSKIRPSIFLRKNSQTRLKSVCRILP